MDSGAELTNMVGSPFWIPPEMIQRNQHGPPVCSFLFFFFFFFLIKLVQ